MKRGKAHPARRGKTAKQPPNLANQFLLISTQRNFLRERTKEKKELQKLKIKSK
jgi:hypothetical protein